MFALTHGALDLQCMNEQLSAWPEPPGLYSAGKRYDVRTAGLPWLPAISAKCKARRPLTPPPHLG